MGSRASQSDRAAVFAKSEMLFQAHVVYVWLLFNEPQDPKLIWKDEEETAK